jgi:hypothetical protein
LKSSPIAVAAKDERKNIRTQLNLIDGAANKYRPEKIRLLSIAAQR